MEAVATETLGSRQHGCLLPWTRTDKENDAIRFSYSLDYSCCPSQGWQCCSLQVENRDTVTLTVNVGLVGRFERRKRVADLSGGCDKMFQGELVSIDGIETLFVWSE